LSVSEGAAANAPVVISVGESGLAVSLEIAIRAHGMDAIIHDARQGVANLCLDAYSTIVVDSEVLPDDSRRFLARLRGQAWRGTLIVLLEEVAGPALMRLRGDGAVLIEKPFGSAELIAEIDRA
jgi:DNA-binding response OmpR family regulator